jgi:hypothetical protein
MADEDELLVTSIIANGWGVWGGCRGRQPTVASTTMAISNSRRCRYIFASISMFILY